jgi:steroid 5-alpha reductase family enzyme
MIDSAWLATTAVAALGPTVVLWAVATVLRNVGIIDAYWGPGFALVAWVAAALHGPPLPVRSMLLLAVITLWAARLGVYLTWRLWGEPEDYRYAAMRKEHGEAFPLRSLFTVFLLQGALLWIISAPLQAAILVPGDRALGWVDGIGVAACVVGIYFEAVGDWQLTRFKSDPANRGNVLDTGLWRYTRHPNYFGDFMVWWGLFLIACLLLKVSGVSLLETTITERRPQYADYIERTSPFFPWPPRE